GPDRVSGTGLAGATFRLLEPQVRDGEAPELARLMAEGCHGVLRSTFPPLTPPAWSSFMTGKNPGKHGVFSFRRLASSGYRSGELITARDVRARTLWEIVSDAGRSVGAINVPPSYPVQPVNGFMVSCMFTPPGEADVIHPPELRPLLGDDYTIAINPPERLVGSDPRYRERCLDYLRRLGELAERRREVTLRLLRERPWDLLSVVFYEPDRIQHFFWTHLAGLPTPDVPPAVAAEIADAARGLYRLLDRSVGELVRAAGPGTTTLVISDHGFAPEPERLVYVNRWLADEGYLRARPGWRWRRRLARRLPAHLPPRSEPPEGGGARRAP